MDNIYEATLPNAMKTGVKRVPEKFVGNLKRLQQVQI